MPSSPTTPPTPESSSSPTFISPAVTAPGLRMRPRPEQPPTPSAEANQAPPPPPLPDPIDTRSGDRPPPAAAAAIKGGTSPWRNMTRGLIAAGSAFVHDRVAVSEAEIQQQTWIATPSEQAQIGDPLATILERHGVPTGENQDMNDLIAAGLGLVGYLMKNIAKTVMARLADRRAKRNAAPIVDAEPWEAP